MFSVRVLSLEPSKIKFEDIDANKIYMLDSKHTPFTNLYVNLNFFDYDNLKNKLIEARGKLST